MVWWMGSNLAQADSVGSSFAEMLPRLVVVFVVGIVLVVGVSILRRKVRDLDDGGTRDFSLGDLRQLKAEGKITQEELDRAKEALVGRVQAASKKPKADAPRVPGERGAEMK